MSAVGSPATDRRGWSFQVEPLSPAQLETYLSFLGVSAPAAAPTLDLLTELQLAHTRAIPFENFDPIAGRTVSLDAADLTAKLLSGTRGGYCFEHNILHAAALTALGYALRLLAGRVLVGAPEARPRTHLALRVDIDGSSWIVDTGFGRTSLNGPLELGNEEPQLVAGDTYRLSEQDGEYLVQSSRGEGRRWTDLYVLDPSPVYPVDVEMANYFVATHPKSHLKVAPVVLRPSAAGKRSLAGGRLVVDEGERQVDREIAPGELAAVLRDEFGIVLPASDAVLK